MLSSVYITVGGYSYYIFLSVLLFLVVLAFQRRLITEKFNFVIIIIFLSSIAILKSLPSIDSILDIRDYLRLFVFFILILGIKCKIPRIFLLYSIVFLLTTDLFFLYILKGKVFGLNIYTYITMSGMQSYTESYWRYIGIYGNPNFSAVLYSMYFLYAFYLFYNAKYRIICSAILFLSLFLMLLTFSRTAMISLLIAVSISYLTSFLRTKKGVNILVVIAISAMLFVFFSDGDFLDMLMNRFTSFSSLEQRFINWADVFPRVSWGGILFGTFEKLPVIDNDYIFYFFRYGLLLTLSIFIILFVIYKKYLFRNKFALSITVLLLVSSIAGGILGHPGLLLVFTLLFINEFSHDNKST